MQNLPRGMINTAFSLGSVASQEEQPKPPKLPTTPQKILKYYINELTDYEKGEVLDYEMIYFLGNSKAKKVDGKQKPVSEVPKKENTDKENPSSNDSSG